MCIKCGGSNGKQITIATSTIVKLRNLKDKTGLGCTSEVIDHLITVFENDAKNVKPTAPQTATNQVEFEFVRSKKGMPVHLVRELKDGIDTECGKALKMNWQVVDGAYADDICTGCRASLATVPNVPTV